MFLGSWICLFKWPSKVGKNNGTFWLCIACALLSTENNISAEEPGSELLIFYLIFLTEVIVIKKNSTNGKIVEEVTFGRSNSKRKTIDIKFPILSPTSGERSRKHKRFHHRRRCCETGDMAAKHGMSCNISRDFRRFFMNQTTRLRMKYQSSPDTGGNIRKRFRSPRIYRIYRKITRCIQQQLKSAVQKCCLAYVDMERSWKRQG